jgi:protein-S-isoprenylcysteine O-methyltransferase Ste14
MKILRGLGFFITTMLFYLGLPLLGWGLGDLQGFFASAPRMGYALVVLILGLATGYQAIDAPEGIRGSKGQTDKLVTRQSIVRMVVILMLLGGLVVLPLADRRGIGVMGENKIVRWAGVLLFGIGCGLVFWSGLALGKMYSADVTIQDQHHLVTRGPYRHIRHPRYAGAILLGFGAALVFRAWMGIALSVIFIGVILFRIRDEEILMHKEFGEVWKNYCERSWRLVPFIY